MAEPDDLLGKADALMARHRQGRPEAETYADIPVLQDVVEDLGASRVDMPVLTGLVPSAEPDLVQVEALAQELRASLFTQLEPLCAQVVEEHLQKGLESLFVRLFTDLRPELRSIACAALNDAIDRAIDKALRRRKSGD